MNKVRRESLMVIINVAVCLAFICSIGIGADIRQQNEKLDGEISHLKAQVFDLNVRIIELEKHQAAQIVSQPNAPDGDKIITPIMTTENYISIFGIVVFVLILAAAVTYIMKSVADSKKRSEALRPNVLISYDGYRADGIYYETMILKNHGASAATIKKVSIEPEIKNNGSEDLMPKPFTNLIDYPLGAGQEIKTIIGVQGTEDNLIIREKRHIIIEYANPAFKATPYKSDYYVDEHNFSNALHVGRQSSSVKKQRGRQGKEGV